MSKKNPKLRVECRRAAWDGDDLLEGPTILVYLGGEEAFAFPVIEGGEAESERADLEEFLDLVYDAGKDEVRNAAIR